MAKKKMEIIIDFDGTVVTHAYPRIGEEIGSVPVLKKLIENGHRLILFTMRSEMRGISPVTLKEEDGGLADAVNWFKKNDIPLYGVQTNPTQSRWTTSPKAYGQLIIDDAAAFAPLKMDLELSDRPFIDWVIMETELIRLGLIK